MIELPSLAQSLGLARIWLKDESHRALGNFKSLGGARAVSMIMDKEPMWLPTFICASDGNHGLAVAAAAKSRGATARVYLPAGVASARVRRILNLGADVVRVEGTYDNAVNLAKIAARANGCALIPDTSDDPFDPVVALVLAGYAMVPTEMLDQLANHRPSHLFIQAGVGGFAAAMVSGLGKSIPDLLTVIVEPASAACVGAALAARTPVQIPGPLQTCADMLSCGLASAGALEILKRSNCKTISVGEAGLGDAPAVLLSHQGPSTTPSGAAGLAGLLTAAQDPVHFKWLGLNRDSEVVLVVTEGRWP